VSEYGVSAVIGWIVQTGVVIDIYEPFAGGTVRIAGERRHGNGAANIGVRRVEFILYRRICLNSSERSLQAAPYSAALDDGYAAAGNRCMTVNDAVVVASTAAVAQEIGDGNRCIRVVKLNVKSP
jgi:hypothetical protein